MTKQKVLKSNRVHKVFCVVTNKNRPIIETCRKDKKSSIIAFLLKYGYWEWKSARKEGCKCIAFNFSQK